MCFVLDLVIVIVEERLISHPDHTTSESESVRHRGRINYISCGVQCKMDVGTPC